MNVLTVNMSCHYTLILSEGFLRKLHCNFVCEFRGNLISAGEALHQMIVQTTVMLVVKILGRDHLNEGSLGRAVDSRHETLVL